MSAEQPSTPGAPVGPPFAPFRHELAAMQQHWWWLLLLGAGMVVLGTVALYAMVPATLVTVEVIGFLLVFAGVFQIVGAFWAGRWSGLLLHLLIGILYTIAGFFILHRPVEGAVELTLIMSMFLVIAGIFRIVASLVIRFHDWGWVLLNGIVTLLLGLMIAKQMPQASLFVIGLFLGIDLIFNGWAWIMLSFGLKASPKLPA